MSKGIPHTAKILHHTVSMLCLNETYEMDNNEESEIRKVLIDNNTDKIIQTFGDIDKFLMELGGAFNYRPSLLFSMMNGEFLRDEEEHECIGCGECMDFDDDGTDEY